MNSKQKLDMGSHAAGAPVCGLVIDMDKENVGLDGRPVDAGQTSQIPQVAWPGMSTPDEVLYTFISDYHEDDIGYALEELFPDKSAKLLLPPTQ